jgi:hypothetical protein
MLRRDELMADTERLPQSVIAEDHQLEKNACRASEALAHLRWHWTLDETNLKRVKIRVYARSVGHAYTTIHAYVNGYAMFKTAAERGTPLSMADALRRGVMSSETRAAYDAVAQARNIAVDRVHQTRATEVRRVRDWARSEAERKGTSVEDEAPQVAKAIVRGEAADRRTQEERRQRFSVRYVELEKYLQGAKRQLIQAAQVAHNIQPWGRAEREVLEDTLHQLERLIQMVNEDLAGGKNVNWDRELQQLTGGAS